MGILASTVKAVTTRRRIAGISVILFAVLIAALWFLDASLFDSTIEYLNNHGGYAALFLVAATIAAWVLLWMNKSITKYSVLTPILITILTIIALTMPMAIGVS